MNEFEKPNGGERLDDDPFVLFKEDFRGSDSEFEQKLIELGFKHYKGGTYKHESGEYFVYQKRGGLFSDLETAMFAKKRFEESTARGLLPPNYEWSMRKKDNGNYQVFAFGEKLSQKDEDFDTQEWEHIREHKYNYLCKRLGLESDSDDFDKALDDTDSILSDLDPKEIIDRQNWGYDTVRNKYYPIDVEVVMFDGHDLLRDSRKAAYDIELSQEDNSIKKL